MHRLVSKLPKLIIGAGDYERHIREEIQKDFPARITTHEDLLKMVRPEQPWPPAGAFLRLLPHRMSALIGSQPCAECWGYRKDLELKTWITSSLGSFHFHADQARSSFAAENGDIIMDGSSIFGGTATLLSSSGRPLNLELPSWRSDWNSGFQKATLIPVKSSSTPVATLILQPFRDEISLVHSASPAFGKFSLNEMFCCVSLAFILSARFGT